MLPPKLASVLRWFQPSLRLAMGFVSLMALALGWVVHLARVQQDIVAAIRQAGGSVFYDHQYQNGTVVSRSLTSNSWLDRHLGPDFFGRVVYVELAGRATDAMLAEVGKLTALEELVLVSAPVTNAGIAHLRGLTRLRDLDLSSTKTTGACFESLQRMQLLKKLTLRRIPIQDADLRFVGKLASLQQLYLVGQPITDAGLIHLRGMRDLREIFLPHSPKITDVGVAALATCCNLRDISLGETRSLTLGWRRSRLAAACSNSTCPARPSPMRGSLTSGGCPTFKSSGLGRPPSPTRPLNRSAIAPNLTASRWPAPRSAMRDLPRSPV